jgi:ribosomal protein L11 methyltransferase
VPISNRENPGWLEIRIDIDLTAHEAVSSFLFDLGCTGIVTEDLQGHSLKAYLPYKNISGHTRKRISAFLQKLDQIFPEIPSPGLTFTETENQDWNRNWRRFFHADRVTRSLLILPAWEPMPNAIDGHVIRIDPGPAFGTGQHATTRMCLCAMEKIHFPKPWTMLDVGTGSGILATYGAKLGASKILAIDIDPEALRWAEQNIQLNDLSEFIDLSNTPLEWVRETFSLVTANLILGQILKLFHRFSHLLKPGGWLILSGILKDQVKEVKRALDKTPLHETETLYQEDWACMIAKKE